MQNSRRTTSKQKATVSDAIPWMRELMLHQIDDILSEVTVNTTPEKQLEQSWILDHSVEIRAGVPGEDALSDLILAVHKTLTSVPRGESIRLGTITILASANLRRSVFQSDVERTLRAGQNDWCDTGGRGWWHPIEPDIPLSIESPRPP